MAPPPTQPRRPIEVGRVINEAFATYAAHAAPLILTALAVLTPFSVLVLLLDDAGGLEAEALAEAISLAATALYTGFVVKLVEDIRDGKRDSSVAELFTSAYAYIGALFVNGVLYGIGVGFGIVAFLIPGLFLFTIWAVCSPVIVAENLGPVAAFARSRDLVRGQGWPVFGASLVGLLIKAVSILVALGAGGSFVVVLIASVLTAPISALIATVLFFDLGGGQPAPGPDGQVVIEY